MNSQHSQTMENEKHQTTNRNRTNYYNRDMGKMKTNQEQANRFSNTSNPYRQPKQVQPTTRGRFNNYQNTRYRWFTPNYNCKEETRRTFNNYTRTNIHKDTYPGSLENLNAVMKEMTTFIKGIISNDIWTNNQPPTTRRRTAHHGLNHQKHHLPRNRSPNIPHESNKPIYSPITPYSPVQAPPKTIQPQSPKPNQRQPTPPHSTPPHSTPPHPTALHRTAPHRSPPHRTAVQRGRWEERRVEENQGGGVCQGRR